MDTDVLLAALGGFLVGSGTTAFLLTAMGRRIEWRRKFLLRIIACSFGGAKTRPKPHA